MTAVNYTTVPLLEINGLEKTSELLCFTFLWFPHLVRIQWVPFYLVFYSYFNTFFCILYSVFYLTRFYNDSPVQNVILQIELQFFFNYIDVAPFSFPGFIHLTMSSFSLYSAFFIPTPDIGLSSYSVLLIHCKPVTFWMSSSAVNF